MYLVKVPPELSDAELHIAILAGDEQALQLWQERVGPPVYGSLRRAGASPEEAEEIWNDAFFETWRRTQREPGIEPLGEGLRRYAFGVARRQLAHRREMVTHDMKTMPLDERDQEPPAEDGVERVPSRFVHALRRCREMVEDRVRVVIDLVMIEATPDEIAERLGIAKTSVSKTVQRAKLALQRCIEGETDVED